MDLLRMSWTNRTFRSVLTNKASKHIWMATFDNIPEAQRPPPCPEDLTEIAYANLLYNPRCMVCMCFVFRPIWLTSKRRVVAYLVPLRIGQLA